MIPRQRMGRTWSPRWNRRDEARTAIEAIDRLGIEPIMRTGPPKPTARAIAGRMGINEVMAGLFPGKKAAHIRSMRE